MTARLFKTVGLGLVRNLRYNNRCIHSSLSFQTKEHFVKKEYKTENNLSYLEDPDSFGTLSISSVVKNINDEDDVKEEKYLQDLPLKSQQLTTKQYADLIKEYVKLKRLKEAIDVLEVRMLKEDRVKPDNYVYNILIGACADFGYTKKAFKLYNDIKKRALKPTGDTYTCLFEACMNNPLPKVGLKNATHLRNLMIEKGIEPNITNLNVMIKTFGRCGDLPTAFKIVDEMVSKKIKIRVQTFNHLLQACISDKESGLRHALLVWRKMLKLREKPNIYTFNLMLKCVKDCNLGSKEDIKELIQNIQTDLPVNLNLKQLGTSSLPLNMSSKQDLQHHSVKYIDGNCDNVSKFSNTNQENHQELTPTNNMVIESVDEKAGGKSYNVELVVIKKDNLTPQPTRTVPNLLSRVLQLDQVLSLQDVSTPQDKFAIIGGQDDFFKEMNLYSIKPNIKTFTQMLPLLDNSTEAENTLLKHMKTLKIRADIDFYNMLMKKRCMRLDYDAAFEVRELIEKDSKSNKRHPLNKKHKLKFNIMTYGILALACKTREKAEQLVNEMNERKLKMNIEMLGALLQNATHSMQFGYILYVMELVKQENLRVNDIFLKHLEVFNDKCVKILEKRAENNIRSPVLKSAYNRFSKAYNKWLIDVNVDEVLKENPWQQFKEPHPDTVQRENITIKEPKKFYKRNRKFIHYTPKL